MVYLHRVVLIYSYFQVNRPGGRGTVMLIGGKTARPPEIEIPAS
ncbi:hypothetical protein [Nostoc sp. NMS8]|nr:hypothetical protein [Nostoc sp. NMS8]